MNNMVLVLAKLDNTGMCLVNYNIISTFFLDMIICAKGNVHDPEEIGRAHV